MCLEVPQHKRLKMISASEENFFPPKSFLLGCFAAGGQSSLVKLDSSHHSTNVCHQARTW